LSAPRPDSIDAILKRAFVAPENSGGRDCPDAAVLASWFDRSLTVEEFSRIDAHVTSCARCQSMLAAIARAEEAMTPEAPARGFRWMLDVRLLAPAFAGIVAILFVARAFRKPELLSSAGEQLALSEPQAAHPIARQGRIPEPQEPVPPASEVASAPRERFQSSHPGRQSSASEGARPPGALSAEALLPSTPHLPATAAQSGLRMSAQSLAGKGAPAPKRNTPEVASAPNAVEPLSFSAPGTIAVDTPDRSFTWLIGSSGRIFKRKGDGPLRSQSSGVSADLLAGDALSSQVCWVVGRSGTVLRTIDGQHWTVLPAPTTGDLSEVQAQSADSAIVSTEDGRGYLTNDGGKTWTRL
jgi:hypothetical protein